MGKKKTKTDYLIATVMIIMMIERINLNNNGMFVVEMLPTVTFLIRDTCGNRQNCAVFICHQYEIIPFT